MIKPKEIKRSNRKTLSIKINREGELIVYAPYYFTEKKINDFLIDKENWIEKHQQQAIKTLNMYSTDNLKIGDYIYLLGEKYQLKTGNTKVVLIDDKNIILPVNYAKNLQKCLKKWFCSIAKDYLKQVLDEVSNKTKLSGYTFKITSARTKWGSCSNKKEIMLNFRLMCCPKNIIEYVATHELVHLKYLNHGKNFYDLLNYFYPNSKAYVKWLKDNSGVLESF